MKPKPIAVYSTECRICGRSVNTGSISANVGYCGACVVAQRQAAYRTYEETTDACIRHQTDETHQAMIKAGERYDAWCKLETIQ